MDYFEWLLDKIGVDPAKNDHIQGLKWLFSTDFEWSHKLDANRAADGVDLRATFAYECGYRYPEVRAALLDKQCSWLEMMVGLAIRIEDNIMSDSDFGDRTVMWFWMMMKSLGLYGMTDDKYDEEYVDNVINTFLYRGYDPNGKGGLFTVNDTYKDMRDIEIWYQMCLFFDNLL